MTKRAFIFLILFAILALIALQTGRRLFYSLAYLLGATLLLSALWAWANVRWLRLNRITQSLRAQVGRPVEERLTVQNLGWLPKLWLEVRDASELPDHHVSRVVHGLGPRRARSWTVKTNARYRGRYRLGPMQIASGDPLGLFSFRRELPQSSAIIIYPATYDLPGFAPPIGRLMGGENLRRRTQHVTPNFAGTRDYVAGDTLNRIHWRSSARAGRLIVKEFEEDPTSDIWLVLDMHHRTHVEAAEMAALRDRYVLDLLTDKLPEVLPITTEYAVTVAASIMRHFLAQNRQVGMIAHAQQREIMQPDRGLRPLTRALEFLAVLQAEGEQTLRDVLTLEEAFFTRGSTVIVVTADGFPSWVDAVREIQRRGVRVVAVLVEPASFKPQAHAMQEVQARLAVHGVPTYLVRHNDSIPVALSAPRL